MFDPITGQPLSEEELQRRKKATVHSVENPNATNQAQALAQAQAQAQAQGAAMQGMNVEDQIRAIHQKFAEKK